MLDYFDVGQIIALSRSCKTLNPLWQTSITTKVNINHFLGRYFTFPDAFRAVQAKVGALIIEGTHGTNGVRKKDR